ncbi:MAG: acyltransferase family protein [Clostridia bacterium]|nr:acyltransferase family protein [Clostridia bacterium]
MGKRLGRYVYIDNLRLFIIILVVIQHFGVTYSGFGSWYYKEGGNLDIFSNIVFGYSMSYTQGFFMGILFLISGFFVPGSYDKKGFKDFMKGRFVRLGIPTLIFMLVVEPLTNYFLLGFKWSEPKPAFLMYYWRYLKSFEFIGHSGPLWFAFALLVFSGLYALIRVINGTAVQKTHQKEIRASNIFFLILLISMGAFLIRLVQPIGTNILNMQLCYFSQYIILFITGIYAYRNDWLTSIEKRAGLKWIMATLSGGFIPWMIIMVAGGVDIYGGGLNWQSASFALWESCICVCTAVGLFAFFSQKLNYQNTLTEVLSDNSFTVYVFHTPIIVGLSLILKDIVLPPLAKCLLLCMIGIPVCFSAAHFVISRIPVLNRVL